MPKFIGCRSRDPGGRQLDDAGDGEPHREPLRHHPPDAVGLISRPTVRARTRTVAGCPRRVRARDGADGRVADGHSPPFNSAVLQPRIRVGCRRRARVPDGRPTSRPVRSRLGFGDLRRRGRLPGVRGVRARLHRAAVLRRVRGGRLGDRLRQRPVDRRRLRPPDRQPERPDRPVLRPVMAAVLLFAGRRAPADLSGFLRSFEAAPLSGPSLDQLGFSLLEGLGDLLHRRARDRPADRRRARRHRDRSRPARPGRAPGQRLDARSDGQGAGLVLMLTTAIAVSAVGREQPGRHKPPVPPTGSGDMAGGNRQGPEDREADRAAQEEGEETARSSNRPRSSRGCWSW